MDLNWNWADSLVFYSFYIRHIFTNQEVQNEDSAIIPFRVRDITCGGSAFILMMFYIYWMYLMDEGFTTDDVEDYYDAFQHLFKLKEDDEFQDCLSDESDSYASAEEDIYGSTNE